MTAALETQGLGKRYGRRMWGLRDCEITLPQGTVTALVGPNGAGKTTLLHLTIGLLRPTEGSVSVFGERSRMETPVGLAQVGFVAQDHPLYHGFSVGDMLHYGRSLNPRWDQRFAVDRLDQLSISLAHRVGRLSGGQQAQLALTLALAKRPRLLVLDEPVASLDPIARRDFLRALVDSIASTDLTVLMSSHVIADLERVCDHLVLMAGGRVRLAGPIDDLLAVHRIVVAAPDHRRAPGDGVVAQTAGRGHTDLLIRIDAVRRPDPRWPSHPVGLEELVLGYLESADQCNATPPAATTEANGLG